MKKLLVLAIACGLSFSVMAQQNVVKLGIGSAFQGDVHLKYERVFGEKHSVQLGLMWDTPDSNIGGINQIDPDIESIPATLSGFAVLPEYRYYFSDKGAPRGFYAGVYGRYRSRTLTSEGTIGDGIEIEGNLKLNNIGGGVGMGVQWLVSDAFVIDWYILGIGYNAFGLSGKVAPKNPDDFDELKVDVNEWLEEQKTAGAGDGSTVQEQEAYQQAITELQVAVDNTDSGDFKLPRVPFGLLDLRFGLSLGYAF